MKRGVMLSAITLASGGPLGVPSALRKDVPPPPDFYHIGALRQDERVKGHVTEVRPLKVRETQAMLEFYALAGHMTNAALDEQLRTGVLANKVRMLTAGVPDDVFTITQML